MLFARDDKHAEPNPAQLKGHVIMMTAIRYRSIIPLEQVAWQVQ